MKLRVICAHTYEGCDPVIVDCTRCGIGWNRKAQRCDAYLGVEHFPLVLSEYVPDCALANRCQHQIQEGDKPCKVRARGMVCELGLKAAGVEDVMGHPLTFNANFVMGEDEAFTLGGKP